MSSEGWKVALTKCRYVQGARAWAPAHELGRDRSGDPAPDTGNTAVPKNTSVTLYGKSGELIPFNSTKR